MKKIVGALFMTVCFLFVGVSAATGAETVYTKYNIHALEKGRSVRASYANYTDPGVGHVIFPRGSKITILKKKRKAFVFRDEKTQKKVVFETHAPRMGMKTAEYVALITSSVPVSLEGFSEIDKKGIAEGKATKGMSKEGVMAALGYPAAHRTSSLEASTWVYWRNRFGTIGVDFDEKGLVKAVRR